MKQLGIIAFVAIGTCLTANAQSGNTEKELIALEQSFSDALLRADWKTVEQIEADDLVFTNADGPVTHKFDEVDAIESGAMKFECIEMSDVKVQDLSNVAVVTGKLVERGRYKTADLSGTYRFTDVWAKRNGRWLLIAGQETRVESASINPAAASSNLSVQEHLIGTWRLVSAGTFRRDGPFEPYPEYGPNARGYLMYDGTGHICVSLANPNHPHWANAEKPTDAEKVRSYDVFFAYCGAYEVREKEGRIIHRPEMGSWPHYIGTDQNRNFRLEGDHLILSDEETPPNGEHRRYQITWQRVSPTSYAAQ
jgi:ketosteroid isomerase-like protein